MKINNRGGHNKGGFHLFPKMRADILWALARLESLELTGLVEHESERIQRNWNRRRARNIRRIIDGTHRKCLGDCGEVKPMREFHKHGHDGHQRLCKKCSYLTVKRSQEKWRERKKQLRAERAGCKSNSIGGEQEC